MGNLHKLSATAYLYYTNAIRYHSPIAQTSSSREHILHTCIHLQIYEINPSREAIAKQMYSIWIRIKEKWVFAKSFLASLCFRFYISLHCFRFFSFPWCAGRLLLFIIKSPTNIIAFTIDISFNIHFTPKPVQLNHQIEQFFFCAPFSNVI